MFTDEALETVGVESQWRRSHQLKQESKSCQTTALKTSEAKTQALHSLESATQTDPSNQLSDKPFLTREDEVDPPGLVDFLNRVTDMVIEELTWNARSHAFDGFEVNWEEQNQTVSRIHGLLYSEAQERKLHVTSVSWNCTGSVIAVAYGRIDDGDWSTTKSFVCTWNLDRRGLDPRRPDVVIDVATPVMCVSFHPLRPSLIAGGLHNGEVVVWDTCRTQDPVLAQTGMSPGTHREPICQVSWVSGDRRGELALLSAGSGGRVLLWTVGDDSRLVLSSGYALTSQQLPNRGTVPKARGGSTLGIASLALSPWDSDVFLAGTEGGLVLKCSFSATEVAAVGLDGEGTSLHAPAQVTFSPRCGPVQGLHCSPFHRHLFLSVGTDGFAHLYSLLQSNPLMSLRLSDSYMFAVRWSPNRPLLFAVATGEGMVQIFDLMSLRPVTTIEQDAGGRPIYCLEFNPRLPQLLATGNADGTVNIWQLSSELTEQGPREVAQLEQLANGLVE